jgi:hypothetical protein
MNDSLLTKAYEYGIKLIISSNSITYHTGLLLFSYVLVFS